MNIEKPQEYYDFSSLYYALYNDELTENDSIIVSDITLKNFISSNILDAIEQRGNLKVIFFQDFYLDGQIGDYWLQDLIIDNEIKDLACAIYCDMKYCPDNLIYHTRNLRMKILANKYFGEDSIKYK